MTLSSFKNPFKPGAGHMPPFLAGREDESDRFAKLLKQDTILENLVLTGLRGVGKTVFLETLKPMAQSENWIWVGTDLSESTSVTEDRMAVRILTDLSVFTSAFKLPVESKQIGLLSGNSQEFSNLDFAYLRSKYEATPGLVSDKLKAVLEFVWSLIGGRGISGIIFAYDEAQNLSDRKSSNEYPLSLMLDVFQSLQRKGIPFMLVLAGLPTLFPKLVDARTFAERMFHVMFLGRLSEKDSRLAITIPIEKTDCPVKFAEKSIDSICEITQGYPYFIQYVCRETFDVWTRNAMDEQELSSVPVDEIMRKLDSDFFAGRWSRATDRQRELLTVVAFLKDGDSEFTVQEIVSKSHELLNKPFSNSHVNQLLNSLTKAGLVYKNRYGKYSLAVPMLAGFIKRQEEDRQLELKI